jgi:hypothetical protein
MRRFLRWLREPEVIGPPDCPLFRRWTIFVNYEGARQEAVLFRAPKWFGFKLLVHHFLPNTEDADPHDHPRALWILGLRGAYLDLVPCSLCHGLRTVIDPTELTPILAGYPRSRVPCFHCGGRGVEVGDEVKPGVARYRPASHRHITKTSTVGAWTLCLMGPVEREWGFWRDGKLWNWMRYEEHFGLAFRCDPDTGDRVVEVGNPTGQTTKEAAG